MKAKTNNNSSLSRPSILSSPWPLDFLGIIFLFTFVLIAPPLASDPGVGWHLKTGQWILENLQIPHHDPFLSSSAGKEWISNQWLADIILWQIYKIGSWDALAIFCFTLPLLVMLWLQGKIIFNCALNSQTQYFANSNKNFILQSLFKLIPFCTLALALVVAWIQWIVRPVVFSFALFSILFYLVWQINSIAYEAKRNKFLLLIAVIFILWANLHSAFPLGIIILLSALLEAVIEKNLKKIKLFIAAILTALFASLINPYGYKLHLNIFTLLGDAYFMKLNNEWLSPSFSDLIFTPLLIAFAVLLFRAGSGGIVQFWLRLLTVIFSLLALKSVRYIPFFGLILPTFIISHNKITGNSIEEHKLKQFFPYGTFALSLVLFVYALFADLDPQQKFSAKIIRDTAMWQAVKASCDKSGGKIYNHPDLGGAITFILGPGCRASIDDRNELNGRAAYEYFFDLSKAKSSIMNENLPSSILIECNSNLVSLARNNYSDLKVIGEYDRFCLLERAEIL